MPRQYEHIRDSYLASGKPEKTAKRLAAMTYIAKGKGGSRSSRAKSLHKPSDGAMKKVVSGYSEKVRKKGKR